MVVVVDASSSSSGSSSSSISSSSHANQIHSLLEQLAAVQTNNRKNNNNNEQQASSSTLWRQVGKLQLDAGEFAEARRIFCFGSNCCPNDTSLEHHVKVFDAFHGTYNKKKSPSPVETMTMTTTTTTTTTTTNPLLPPLLKMPPDSLLDDLFVSLEVPPDAIPKSIQQHSESHVPPLQRTRLIHATTRPLLSKRACQYLIKAAMEAAEQRGGWTKDRHVQAPTCDIPVFELHPNAQHWVCHALHDTLFPLLAQVVAPELIIDPKDFRVQDCFIVRYDGQDDNSNNDNDNNNDDKNNRRPGFPSLKPHQDESLLSLTIALNDMEEYGNDGGGLYIASTGDVLNGPAGTVLCFAGGLVHGGYPVRTGTRWILTVFLYVDLNQSGKRPGYTLEQFQEIKEKIMSKQQQQQQQPAPPPPP